jgi:hypothetical protein
VRSWLTRPRLAGIFGLGYFFGIAVENQEALDSPTLQSPASEIREALADQAFATIAYTAGALALVSYVAFVLALHAWLRGQARSQPWATIALVGGVGGPLVAAFGLVHDAVLIADVATSSDDRIVDLYEVYLRTRIVSGIFVAMFVGGFGMAALRTRALPGPLCWLALALAGPMALAPLAAFDRFSDLELAVWIAFAAQTLWIFMTSMWLILGEGGVSPFTFLRRAAFLLLALAAGSIGLALVAAPGATGQFFAWVLAPEPLAAFAGGVYVGSAIAYALALPRWARQVRGLVLGAVVLSVSVFVITITHADQFDFDRLQAIMWVVLFAAFSLVTAALFLLDRGQEQTRPARLAGWARAILAVVAAVGAALALALWIDPTEFSAASPFELPPLGGRFMGSWIALLTTACGWAALRDRVDEARPAAWLLVSLPAGALVAALRAFGQLQPDGAAAAYVAALAAVSLAGVAVLRTSRSRLTARSRVG